MRDRGEEWETEGRSERWRGVMRRRAEVRDGGEK